MAETVDIQTVDAGIRQAEVDADVPAELVVLELAGLQGPWPKLCPLPDHCHDKDSQPGFNVYPGARGWYCWGCHRGGKTVRFVEIYCGLKREAAIRLVEKRWLSGTGSPGLAAVVASLDAEVEAPVRHISTAQLASTYASSTVPVTIEHAKLILRKWNLSAKTSVGAFLATLRKWKVRYNQAERRFWLPVIDRYGILMDVRRRSECGSTPKVLSMTGHGLGGALFGSQFFHLQPSKHVVVVGGEKDAIVGDHFFGRRFLFVSSTRGEGGWSQDTMSEPLRGRHVAVFLDNDDAGRRATVKTLDMLRSYVVELRRVQWTGLDEQNDLTELVAAGTLKCVMDKLRNSRVVIADALKGVVG